MCNNRFDVPGLDPSHCIEGKVWHLQNFPCNGSCSNIFLEENTQLLISTATLGTLVLNIAKGTTDTGVDCFNQINNLKNHATYPQAMQPLSHHITTPDIAKPMVTNTGLVETNPCWFIQFSSFGLVYLVWYVCLQSPHPPAVGLILEPLCLRSPQGP